jgi:hypothetical protein
VLDTHTESADTRRSAREHRVHDRHVRQRARQLKEDGYLVWAATAGFAPPAPIRGHRPDILAIKQGRRLIIQVETVRTASTNDAGHKRRLFEKVARRSVNTVFCEELV